MVRWEPDGRGRLEQAALALFGERGFENTTVAEIASRAGLTERTFFRYFTDKREVLFSGSTMLQELLVDAVVGAPESASAIEAVAAGLDAVGAMFDGRQDHARQRQAVIVASAELRERELIKLATLGAAVADALGRRGVPAVAATLTAEAGMAVFRVAFERWVDDAGSAELQPLLRESLEDLRTAIAAP
ncbi:MAG TPA: TetR family transcriptional regulator [Pseudonocardia sp.]|jgi:AcrR family transcriptional regulator